MRAIESSRESVVEFLISKGYVWNFRLKIKTLMVMLYWDQPFQDQKGFWLIYLGWNAVVTSIPEFTDE